MSVRFVPTPELRAAALPRAEGKLVLPTSKLLVAGAERSGMGALQDWLVATLDARARFAAKTPSPSTAQLQALIAMGRKRIAPFANALVAAYGIVTVFRAIVATAEVTLATERSYAPKAEWLLPPTANVETTARELPILVTEWIDALRPAIEDARVSIRDELVAIAAEARPNLALGARASLSRAFRNGEWAALDAAETLAIANPELARGRGLSPVRMLLGCLLTRETFAKLETTAISENLFASGLHAEIALFMEPAIAVESLCKLFEKPLAKESPAYVTEVAKVIACFDCEDAAEAIAACAHVIRDEATAYFTAYPQHIARLAQRAKGRGRKVDAVRAILDVLERGNTIATEAADEVTSDLPRCIAVPPWTVRAPPWPARELSLLAAGREYLVETPGLVQAKSAMERWASKRRPSSEALDAEILAKKGVIEPERYLELTEEAALAHVGRLATYSLEYAIARFEERAIPALSAIFVQKPMKTHAALIAMLRTPKLAEVAFRVHGDEAWILEEPSNSALGLLPALFSSDLERRWDAERGLLLLAVKGHEARIFEAARLYGADVEDATRAILARDPNQRLPPKLPPVNPVFESGTLPPLRTPSGALPASGSATVGTLLAVSDPWLPHPGLLEIRAQCTTESRDAFAWEAYGRTMDVEVLAHLGADDSARGLGERLASKRSTFTMAGRFAAYSALGRIDTPLSRMMLLRVALESPWRDRTEYVESLLAARARARGVPNDILEEDVFPSIAGVPLVLDFGSRTLEVRVDDQLASYLVDEAGARLPKVPRPSKKDDPNKTTDALARYEAFVADLENVRTTALVWLERAMAEERRWTLARFRSGILAHPALRRLARGLVWKATWPGADTHLRVAEDATFANATDATVAIPETASMSVAHPAAMDASEREAFAKTFLDYEVLQPFEQLHRKTFVLLEGEAESTALARYAGFSVATAKREKLLGARGWQEGERERYFVKRVRAGEVVVQIGATSVHRRGETAADRLASVGLSGPKGPLPFARLGVVEASELLRDLEGIRLEG